MQTQRDSCGLHYCLTPEYKQFCWNAWSLRLIVYCSYNMSRFQAHSRSCKKRLLASSGLSARPRAITGLPLDGCWWNFMSRGFQFCDIYWILPKIQKCSDKWCRENQYTHFTSCTLFPHIAVYAIIMKNAEQPDRPLSHRNQYGAEKILQASQVLRQKMQRVILLFPSGLRCTLRESIIMAKLLNHNI